MLIVEPRAFVLLENWELDAIDREKLIDDQTQLSRGKNIDFDECLSPSEARLQGDLN